MNKIRDHGRIGFTEVTLGIFALVVILQLMKLLFYRKIEHLFVDDWAIFSHFSTIHYGINTINLEPYNGHSLIVTRILFIFISEKIGIGVSTFSIILTIVFVGTLIALIKKINLTVPANKRLVLALSIVLISLNLNQYQNFTMPICWSWIICLTLIFWTYIISSQELTFTRGTTLLIFSLLGPLTLSLGFIIPGFIILKTGCELLLSRICLRKVLYLILIILCTLFCYRIAIVNSVAEYGGFASPSLVFTEPLKASIFVLTSIGAPFTPASQFSVYIASIFGFGILILVLRILQELKNTSALFMEDSLITMGVIFHAIHLVGRFDGSWDSVAIAAQPRYSTGGVLLLLGVAVFLTRASTRKIEIVLIVLLGTMSISGIKTAENFASVRHTASAQISYCAMKLGLASKECGDLLYPGSKVINKAKFNEALRYLENLHK